MSLNHDNIATMMNQGLTISLSAGGTSAVWGFLTDFAIPLGTAFTGIMATVAMATFMVTWHFKREENRRKNEAHDKLMGRVPDKIEGTDNDQTNLDK